MVLSSAATMGSSVRARGWSSHNAKPSGSTDGFRRTAAAIDKALEGIERLPVIPREIVHIFAISTTE